MDSSAAREGDQKIPSARLPGEYGAPAASPVLAIADAFASRRASADTFRKLAAKLRRDRPMSVGQPAAAAMPVVAAMAEPEAPIAPLALPTQPEIEFRTEAAHRPQPQPVERERFDMGWTYSAISRSSPPRRRTSEQSPLPVDEFADLPPEFSDGRKQAEALARVQSDLHQAAGGAPMPVLGRPDNFRFWEQPPVLVPAEASSEDGSDSVAKVEPVAAEPRSAGLEMAGQSAGAAVLDPAKDLRAPALVQSADGGPQAAAMAWSLLEIISLPTDTTQPQERALAADALLQLLPKLTLRTLMATSDRMSLMDSPPRLIVNQLVRDPRVEISGPLLEKGVGVSDQDLLEVIGGGQIPSIRMIARRRIVSSPLCDAVIATGEPSAILTLVRNPGASISHEGFIRLNAIARQHTSLQAPLATRSDLPAPVAFELFWSLPVELRRYVLSRFLTDSRTLERILKITKSVENDSFSEDPPPGNFPARERIDQLVALVVSGDLTNAAKLLAELAGVQERNAARIIADSSGEPMAAALKALGVPRARFEEVIDQCRLSPACALRPDRKVEELQSLFDTLSFNKARVLLTYWDWAAAQTGPYEIASARFSVREYTKHLDSSSEILH